MSGIEPDGTHRLTTHDDLDLYPALERSRHVHLPEGLTRTRRESSPDDHEGLNSLGAVAHEHGILWESPAALSRK